MVRPMAEADLEAVRLLAAATPEAPHWELPVYRGFLANEAGPRRIFIAEISGEVAGFIAGQLTLDMCELESIAVAPQHRRAGVGGALLAVLAEWAGASRAVKMQLEVRSANQAAISFYERSGFRRDGTRRGYYRHPEDDALLMSLPLTGPSTC